MRRDISLPVIVVISYDEVRDGDDRVVSPKQLMSSCFNTEEQLIDEAMLHDHYLKPDEQTAEPESVSDAINRVCMHGEHICVSRDKWTEPAAKAIESLYGRLTLDAILHIAKREAWPMFGMEPVTPAHDLYKTDWHEQSKRRRKRRRKKRGE